MLTIHLSRPGATPARGVSLLKTLALIAVAGLIAAHAGPARADVATYVVFDAASGTVYDQKDPTRPWRPASVTKLMTAYVTFRALRSGTMKLSSPVYYSQNARKEPPSKMGFQVGTVLTLDNALKMMLVKSANDIAVAVAESVGGSEAAFVAQMNAEARRLGMRDTHFANPNGLPDNRQVTTVRDMGLLARALIREFPEYGGYFRIGAIRHGNRVLKNYNALLHYYRGADGMKTGYICDSGLNLVASATRGGRRVVAVLFGAQTGYERAAIARVLLDKGFAGRSGFGKASIENVRSNRTWGAPPTGYCKLPNPSIDELLARYGGGTQPVASAPGPVLGYANNSRIRALPPGIAMEQVSAGKKAKKTKDNKDKLSGEEILTRLVGPPQAYTTVQVSVGGADDVSPRAHLQPIDGVAVEGNGQGVPLPLSHPERVASNGSSLFAKAGGPAGSPARLLPAAVASYPKVVAGIPVPQPRPAR